MHRNHKRIINDWFIELCLDRLNLTPLKLWLIVGTGSFIVLLLTAFFLGDLFSHDGIRGYLDNYATLFIFLFNVPLIVVLYVFLAEQFSEAITDLSVNKVFLSPKTVDKQYGKDIHEFSSKARRFFRRRTWTFVSIILGSSYLLLALPFHLESDDWLIHHPATRFAIESFWLVMFSFTALYVIRVLSSIWWLNKAMSYFRLNLHPLHYDGLLGLGPLGKYSLRLGYMVILVGSGLSGLQILAGLFPPKEAFELITTYDLVIAWTAYGLLATVVLVLPNIAAHKAMIEWKRIRQNGISQRYDREFGKFEKSKKLGKRNLTNLEHLHSLSEKTKSYPEWPFRLDGLAQMYATFLLPIAIQVIVKSIAP